MKYKYKSIGSICETDNTNVTVQGCICKIYDLLQDLAFCLVIFDKESIKNQCEEIQCYFWKNQTLKYSKQMFKLNQIYDFVNPKIVKSNGRYHPHKFKMYIKSCTKIILKPMFNIQKSNMTCIMKDVAKLGKKNRKRKRKKPTNNHKITNYFTQTKKSKQMTNFAENKILKNELSKKKSKTSQQPIMDNWLKKKKSNRN